MAVNARLLDSIQLNNHIQNINFGCEYAEDGRIFLLLEKGVCVFTLKSAVDNMLPRFAFKKGPIELSDSCICDYLDINVASFINKLSKEKLYEAVLDVSLSGNEISVSEMQPKPVAAMWSPRGIVDKTDGALAVLTNLHNIEIYVEATDENEIGQFVRVTNFSRDIAELYKRTWKKVDGLSNDEKLEELKKRVDLVIPTAFTWSHVILKDRKACCILFVGHRDGSITAWRFVERKSYEIHESRLQFLECYRTKFKEITALHWFCTSSDRGGMAFGDIDGQIGCLSVSDLSTTKVRFHDEIAFATDKDLSVDKIVVFNHEDFTYVVIVKKNYIQVYAINDLAQVFVGKIYHVCDLYLTGIVHYEKNSLLVLSVSGELKQLDFKISPSSDDEPSKIMIAEKLISLDFDTRKFRTHGLVLSPNKVFFGILAYPCHLTDLSKGKNFVNFFIYGNQSKKPFELLMDVSNNLRDFWDCFETLRVTSIQDKTFPWEGISRDLNYDTLPLIKLKVLRWIAKISEKVYTIIPRIEEYNIKAYVLLNYMVDIKLAVGRMTKLLNIYFSEKKLPLFQMQSMDLLNFFLKEMVAKDILAKANLGETFIDEIYGVMRIANEIQYPLMPQCLWCGERIIGSSCVPYHPDSRCAISLMPIYIVPGYKCPFCKCVVAKDIDKEYYPIFCPYCDIPMKRRHYEKKSETISSEDVVMSDCFGDCLNESQNINDIEVNKVEYVILTDSEDENHEKLNDLFAKIRKLAISRVSDEEKNASKRPEDVTLSEGKTSKNQCKTPIKIKKRTSEEENSDVDDNIDDSID